MARFPAVLLPVTFSTTANSFPVTLPVAFGQEAIDNAQTVTAATDSVVTRIVYADSILSVGAETNAAVDRFVTAEASTGVSAGLSQATDRETFVSGSTDVTADISSTDAIHIPSSNVAEITITAGFTSGAILFTSFDTILSVDGTLAPDANNGLFVSSSTEVGANRDFDLFHVANTDSDLSVAVDPLSSMQLWARASASLAVTSVIDTVMNLLANAECQQFVISVTRTTRGNLTAYITGITDVDAAEQSSEINTAVANGSKTIAVQLDSSVNSHVLGNTTRAITAAITSRINSLLVGNTSLYVTEVSNSFLSRHQNLDSSTVVDVSTVAIGTLPLIYAKVQADDRHSTVAESLRMSVVTLSGRDSGVTVAQRTVSVPAEGDPRSAPVAMLTNSPVSRRSGSLFA